MPTDKIETVVLQNNFGRCVYYAMGNELFVSSLYVKDGARGQGIGSDFIRELQKQNKRITLYPISEDYEQEKLERFYRRLGFKPDFFDADGWEWLPDDKPCSATCRVAIGRNQRQRSAKRR